MKSALYTIAVMAFITLFSFIGLGCIPLEQVINSVPSPGSSPAPSSAGTGMVEVHITDAPPQEQVTSVLVTVSRVEIHRAGSAGEEEQNTEQEREQEKQKEPKKEPTGVSQKPEQKQSRPAGTGNKPAEPEAAKDQAPIKEQEKEQEQTGGGVWTKINIKAPATFDLLKIKGLVELFAVSQVEAGKYTQVRLIVDNVDVWLDGKKAAEVKLPSGELKLVHPFEVVAGETTVVLLDFDADKSVTVTGAGKVMVKPVIKLDVKQKPAGKTAETEKVTQEESQKIAAEYVKKDETFTFDGIADTLKLTGTDQANCPYCWVFTFEFDSRQAGYGNRTGQVLAQVITHHKAVITMQQGRVASAIMDGRWDMVKEKEISAQTPGNSPLIVGGSYHGREVEVKVGQVLAVTLDSNPSTGYSWQLKNISDRAILENTGSEFVASGSIASSAGALAKEIWQFKALKEGKSSLTLEYRRPWEKEAPPENVYTLTVKVA